MTEGRIRVLFYANETPVEKEDGTHYEYDFYIVETTDRPNIGEIISGALDGWIEAAAKKELDAAAAAVREVRNRLLTESDAAMALDRMGLELPDSITATTMLKVFKSLVEVLKNAVSGDWAKYRQALRDIPNQPGFPYEINWPKKPE